MLAVPQATAQQTYTQPMLPIGWTSKTILVNVPTNPTWALDSIQQAMQDWNQAQTWFLSSYEPNHQNAMYTLQLAQTGQTAQVTVLYVSDTGQQWDGYTYDGFTKIAIVMSRYGPSNAFDVEILAEHELGHVLGLADNCVNSDLMRGGCNNFLLYIANNYPSTLDLYAVYLQVITGNSYGYGDSIILPTQIPFSTWSPRTYDYNSQQSQTSEEYTPQNTQTYSSITQATMETSTIWNSSQLLYYLAIGLWAVAIIITIVTLVWYFFYSRRPKSIQTKLDSVFTETHAQSLTKSPPQESMMFCNQCGSKITRDSKFCKECGAKQQG
jgi:hypothetical protein